MKTIYLAILWFVCSSVGVLAQEMKDTGIVQSRPMIMNSKTGTEVKLEQLVNELAQCDVAFLGEQHDNDAGHEFQFNVIRALVDRSIDVVIATEQFERDVQGVVDDYLAGRIDEEEFLEKSRPWKNYTKHYRPIIELAKAKHLPVLAANVPRKLASGVVDGKTKKSGQHVFLPRSTSAPEDSYWQNFAETMKGHMGAEGAEKLKKFYAAQCIKDDAMAESITDYLARNQHRPKLVVHLCGHFHSDYGLGTAARVVQRKPLARISVVTMETIPESGKPEMDGVRERGHFVFWTVKNESKAVASGE